MKTAIYIAGPMTGIPQFNYPAFEAAYRSLATAAFWYRRIISPHLLDSEKMQALAWRSPDGNVAALSEECGETWGDVLARDVRIIEKEVCAFWLLPGWHKSRGARLEVFVGLLTGVDEFYVDGKSVSVEYIRAVLRRHMP